MNFIKAIKLARQGQIVRRAGWANGVVLSVYPTKGYHNDEYISVSHIAACKLDLTAGDVLAEDWEIRSRG